MPTVLDYVREKDPRFKDVPDAQLTAYIKERHPDLASSLPQMSTAPRTDFQKRAASQKLGIEVGQHAATMEEEIGAAKGKAAKDIGKAAVLGAAALGTGGLAAGPAAALMGTAGVGAEAVGETLRAGMGGYGSAEAGMSAKKLAFNMGLEGALSAGGEAGVRALGQGLKYVSKEMFPAIVMRSAAKAEQGQQALVRVQQDTFDQLRDFVRTKGNPTINIGNDIEGLFEALRKRATGSSQAFKDATKPVFAKLWKAAEGSGSLERQPIDALMEIKSDLNHIAYKVKGMNTDEMVALRRLAEQVDGKITSKLGELGGGAATRIYRDFKAFTEQIRRDDAALSVAETGVKKLMGKFLGEYVPGVGSVVDEVVRGKVAPWMLEHLFSNPKTAELVKKAVNMEAVGQSEAAQKAFEAAVNASGVGTMLKDVLSPEKRAIAKNPALDALSMMPPIPVGTP